jgi:hypothetical protein
LPARGAGGSGWPDGHELALRASNLAVQMPASQTLLALGETRQMPRGADVEMHSLVRSPELNSGRGKVVEPQDPQAGTSLRCGVCRSVKIDSDGRVRVLTLAPHVGGTPYRGCYSL